MNVRRSRTSSIIILLATLVTSFYAQQGSKPRALNLPKLPNIRYNIIFTLLDDQRYDAMGLLPRQGFFETPNMAPMWVRNQRNSWHGVDFF